MVNPIGGKGNAMSLVNSLALPVYRAAGCEVDVIGKRHHGLLVDKEINL